MPILPTPTDLPNDGESADAGDYNPYILALYALLNGGLDGDNFIPGSLPWAVMDAFTDSIPATAMQDNGNLELYRLEAQISFVASGIVWSATTGLGASMTDGYVYATSGKRVKVDAVTNRAFTASKDTYVDIAPNGTVNYSEVSNNAAAPVVPTGYIRIAVVVTSGSAVTAIHGLARRNPGNEIGRFTAGAATDRLTVQNIPKKKHITIRAILLASGDLNSAITLNNDSGGTNYDYGQVNNNGSYTSVLNNPQLEVENGSTNGTTFVEMAFYNILSRWKTGKMESVVNASPPNQRTNYFSWKNTTQDFNRIDIVNMGTGDFAAGSEIIVYGDD